ncbi:MAG: bifunctional 4-hydroxy-2-oxoglutarate aldolase/2-dehydro-3-deoxy-phosphogluconate aldolase [Betaproteobacteria bacterium]|nr:bifunctional 4-hydroxy-2-oxoglutarate aldolase/2-dehydro-3-deoxy-phosphogluconate aldolase [Betaproteobacteria bacterium]
MNLTAAQSAVAAVMTRGPVIPVIVVDDVTHAAPLARALVAGGLSVLEVTLRTAAALEAVRIMRDAVPEAVVGVGTVLNAGQLDQAHAAGAAFAVSPGTTEQLLQAALDHPVPLLPGASTVSEAMRLRELGFRHLKFFPAEASGGVRFLSSLASVIADLRFCPTGGVTPQNAPSYLALPNVLCVGGSWMIPRDRVAAEDWTGITSLAAEASRFSRGEGRPV